MPAQSNAWPARIVAPSARRTSTPSGVTAIAVTARPDRTRRPQPDRRLGVRPGQPERVDDRLVGDVEGHGHRGIDVGRLAPEPRRVDELRLHPEITGAARDLPQAGRVLVRPADHQRAAGQRWHPERLEELRPALGGAAQEPRLVGPGLGIEAGVDDRAVRLAGALADIRLRLDEDRLDPAGRELQEDRAPDHPAADDDRLRRLVGHADPSAITTRP